MKEGTTKLRQKRTDSERKLSEKEKVAAEGKRPASSKKAIMTEVGGGRRARRGAGR